MPEQELNTGSDPIPETEGLTDGDKSGRTTFDVTEDAHEAVKRVQRTRPEGNASEPLPVIDADEVNLRIEVKDSATPLLLTLTDKALIGRRDPAIQVVPELDLTPYGGYQMGISRRHAILSVRDGRLELMDLGSRNGTYIDGRRLNPHQPQPLYDGAEVRLGKITMNVHMQ